MSPTPDHRQDPAAPRGAADPADSRPPVDPPHLRRVLGELTTVRDAARLVRALPRQALRHRPDATRDVIVVPGFLAADGSTLLLRQALARDGHRVRGWRQGRNVGDFRAHLEELTRLVAQVSERSGHPVDLVGWSLGGAMARGVAYARPEHVRRVVTLATPLHGHRYTSFASWYERGDGETPADAAARRRRSPPPVPTTVVWTRRDGVVHWRAQLDPDNPWAEHVEVGCTHLGMTFDPGVLDVLRDRVGRDVARTPLRAPG